MKKSKSTTAITRVRLTCINAWNRVTFVNVWAGYVVALQYGHIQNGYLSRRNMVAPNAAGEYDSVELEESMMKRWHEEKTFVGGSFSP